MMHNELTELLAYRDPAERASLPAERRAALEGDPELAAKLARLERIADALRKLPEQPPDASVWSAIQARLHTRRPLPTYRRHWRALAAGVVIGTLAAVVLIERVGEAQRATVADLIATSQALERSWLARPHNRDSSNVVRAALLYRIASVDSELNRMTASGVVDRSDLEALWETRVTLLQSLLEIDQGEPARFVAL